jgi:hypothetical protein
LDYLGLPWITLVSVVSDLAGFSFLSRHSPAAAEALATADHVSVFILLLVCMPEPKKLAEGLIRLK